MLSPPHATRSGLEEVALPVDDEAHLIACGSRILLREDRPARAEPYAFEESRPLERHPIVDGEIVLALIGRVLARGRVDGVLAPNEIHVGAEAFGEHVREVVGRAEEEGLLPGPVEV